MHPVLITLGKVTITWFGVFMATGFLAGLLNWILLGRREGRDPNFSSDLLLWVMVAGILGGRLAYVVSEWDYFSQNPFEIIRIDQGGLIYYGGLMAVCAMIVMFARTRQMHIREVLDFVATSVPLAHAFGRIGCFMNGCCHGAVTTAWTAVSYPAKSQPWWTQVKSGQALLSDPRSQPVHPVQLYEAALNILLFLVVRHAYVHRRCEGVTTAVYLMGYAVIRFGMEFLRGDQRMPVLGINMAQTVSIAVFAAGTVLLLISRRTSHEAHGQT